MVTTSNGDNDALNSLSESFLASATEYESLENREPQPELDQKALIMKSDKTLSEAQEVLRRHQFNKYDEKSEVLKNVAIAFDKKFENEALKHESAVNYSNTPYNSTNSYYPAFTAPSPTFVNTNPGLTHFIN